MIRISKATWTLTVVIGAAILPASAAPKAPDGDPGWYLRQDTWQDTMRVSREALVRHLAKEADAEVPGSPTSVRFTPNGKYLLMSHLDSALRLWDVAAGREVKKYVGHRNAKFSLTSDVWTHAGGAITSPLVVSGSEDGSVYLWDVSDMRVVARMLKPIAPGSDPSVRLPR